MRVLICGDRNWTNQDVIRSTVCKIHSETPIDFVIEGEARGADRMGREVAEEHGITVLAFPADWVQFGKRAGPIRNLQMLREGKPDLVLAFHDDIEHSRGTKHMVEIALRERVPIRVVAFDARP